MGMALQDQDKVQLLLQSAYIKQELIIDKGMIRDQKAEIVIKVV